MGGLKMRVEPKPPHRLMTLGILAAMLLSIGTPGAQGQHPIGLKPLPENLANQYTVPIEVSSTLAASLDWRDAGIITPSKDQQDCGSCWAFAGISVIEAMAIQAGASAALNLSEQYAVSCDVDMDPTYGVWNEGCCGGYCTVFTFFEDHNTITEAAFAYNNGDYNNTGPRDCDATPSWNQVDCPSPAPAPTDWRVASWNLIGSGIPTLKTALIGGPIWIGFTVWSDFDTFWASASAGDVYTHASGVERGGHAITLIGYDDTKSAWLIKNSWGITGPEGDGTCWISYTANTNFGINPAVCTVEEIIIPTAACCAADESCDVAIEDECVDSGGTWLSGTAACDPDPCGEEDPDGACCQANGTCTLLTETECATAGGTWHSEWTVCSPNPCPQPPAVCCAQDGSCQLLTLAQCAASGGAFHSELSTCSPNPCPGLSTEENSWGSIKSIFRKRDDK